MVRCSRLAKVVHLGAVLLCCVLLAGCKKDNKGKDGNGDKEKAKVSKANFAKVKEGMSPKEVEEILGPPDGSFEVKPGELPGGTKLPGVPDMPDMPKVDLGKFAGKEWKEANKVYHVVFKDDKVMAKEVVEDKEKEKPASKITKANYDRIKTGMTKKQVEEILGKGKTGASGAIEDFSGATVVWKDGDKIITIGFLNDKVKIKTESGL
jgi:outer membrane protein assembly factor BamE (lipoprotein component of BamABCDE complex)